MQRLAVGMWVLKVGSKIWEGGDGGLLDEWIVFSGVSGSVGLLWI